MNACYNQIQPIHILAVGRDTEILHRLFQYAMQFTQRSVGYSSGNHLVSKVVPDRYNSSNYFIEGKSFIYTMRTLYAIIWIVQSRY